MERKIEEIVDKYLGMKPGDVNCNSWMLTRSNMIEEIKQLNLGVVMPMLLCKHSKRYYTITKDKEYQMTSMDNKYYWLIDDDGNDVYYKKELFEVVAQ